MAMTRFALVAAAILMTACSAPAAAQVARPSAPGGSASSSATPASPTSSPNRRAAAVTPPAGFPAATIGTPVASATSDYLGGMSLVAATVTPKVDAEAAYTVCATDPSALCLKSAAPTVQLVAATSDVGAQVRADRNVTRVLSGAPVWMFTWPTVPCRPSAGAVHYSGASDAAGTCTRTMFVSASTGAYLFTEDDAQ